MADTDRVTDPFVEVECGIDGCAYSAKPISSTWPYHYNTEHPEHVVTVKIEYDENDGCDLCGARRALNGHLVGMVLHKGDCRG